MKAVPPAYRGVWQRTLLRTPGGDDTHTWVRWLQTSLWHADLRVPAAARDGTHTALARQQGFSGVTTVQTLAGDELCTWQRRVDFSPPGPHPDVGRMVFETPERVVETGVHGDYLEIWERLPGSTGRYAVLEADAPGGVAMRWLVAGDFAMQVRPRALPWPADLAAGDSLGTLLARHPASAAALLDFEITFGRLAGGLLHIEHSTVPALEGSTRRFRPQRDSETTATLDGVRWRIVEWTVEGAIIAS